MCKCNHEIGVIGADTIGAIVADAVTRIIDRYEVPPMLSIEAAAEKLDCSKEMLRSFITSGELPAVVITDRIQRIRISDLNTFLNSRIKPVVTAAPAAPAEAASEVGHEDDAPAEEKAPAAPAVPAATPEEKAPEAPPAAPVVPAAPAAPAEPVFERCTAQHPKTGKRCVLAAGHDGNHKLED